MGKNGNIIAESIMIGCVYGMFALYHAHLIFKVKMDPLKTTIGQNRVARYHWCKLMTITPANSLLAAQTLRNGMMASSLLATAALTLSAIVAAYLINNFAKIPGIEKMAVLAATDIIQEGYKFFVVLNSLLLVLLLYAVYTL